MKRSPSGLNRYPMCVAGHPRSVRRGVLAALAMLLSGCMLGPSYHAPSARSLGVPDAWHASLPHDGSVTELAHWWQQFDDPELTVLIETAQQNSPTIGIAAARLREARAVLGNSRAALLPRVDGSASFNRSNTNTTAVTSADVNQPAQVQSGELNTGTALAEASWELDLFGKLRRQNRASEARVAAGVAGWHDARVSVAADVGDTYARLRACQALLRVEQSDQQSRQTVQAITAHKVQYGFASSADAALTHASVAEAVDSIEDQRSLCEQDANELTALTGVSRTQLDAQLAPGFAQIPVPRGTALSSVPAESIAQRPDVRASERELAAASEEIGAAIAARLPSFSLTGSIGVDHYQANGQALTLRPWAFGPGVTVPLFDGGSGAANVENARGRFDEARYTYEKQVRQAVLEVENALTRVDSSVRREDAASQAEQNYRVYFDSAERQYRGGSRDALDLETSRRQLLAAQQRVAAAQLERAQAWISLYRAVGGGWGDIAVAANACGAPDCTDMRNTAANTPGNTPADTPGTAASDTPSTAPETVGH
jgi:NodT family efflux transporter outer membrane factor (OMF) lipoprotein